MSIRTFLGSAFGKKFSLNEDGATVNKVAHEFKKSRVSSLLSQVTGGMPLWTPREYGALAKEGYERNVVAFRAVTLIARSIAGVSWFLKKGTETYQDHPLLSVLKTPSPQETLSSLVEGVISSLLLSGNAYIEVVRDENGCPLELYLLRADRVKVIPGSDGVPIAYEYSVSGESRRVPVDTRDGWSPILHLKMYHPRHDWYGFSPMEAAASSIDQYNAVGQHNLSLLKNGARPSGALLLKTHQGEEISDEQRQSLREDLESLYEGTEQAGRFMVLEGDMEWREMGLSPKDLDFVPGKHLTAREISMAFGVPPMLIGVPGDATFSNYKEARFHLWEDTLLPMLDKVMASFSNWLISPLEKGLKFAYDIDKIPALSLRRESIWERMCQASFLTINEKRVALGFPPLPGNDQINSIESVKGEECEI